VAESVALEGVRVADSIEVERCAAFGCAWWDVEVYASLAQLAKVVKALSGAFEALPDLASCLDRIEGRVWARQRLIGLLSVSLSAKLDLSLDAWLRRSCRRHRSLMKKLNWLVELACASA
jgi:hypothetical protein